MGKSFGVSTSFQVMCAAAGAGKRFSYFDIDLKENFWRIAFVVGAFIGGAIGANYLQSPEPVAISEATISHLEDWGIDYPETIEEGSGMIPTDVFNLGNLKGVLLAIVGGFLVGFGTRYAGGCTSGHAITGLSHLQLPSLIAVIGFFAGGLIMTFLIMPLIFG
ncbi:MAG: hypothetical protein DHS20C18_54540 [Saprospiraceae bacterium]|nr:MAG: hypothetical protein DHS20C18_54540 [Saprospiraceae bacterium]